MRKEKNGYKERFTVKLCEIYKIADELAPKALSDEYCARYGAYDNSGVLVDAGEEIVGVVCSLDLSDAAIDKAIALGANLIITHHPAIYGKLSTLCIDDPRLTGGKMVRCLKQGISVLSMHLNLDGAVDGIDESLMNGILKAAAKTTGAGTDVTAKSAAAVKVMHPLTGGGYGRVYDLSAVTLSALCKEMEKEFSTKRIVCYGDANKLLGTAASFCGAGVDEGAIVWAAKEGADVIVSADFKHHLISMAMESGLSVIALTHYASENYGFEKFYQKIRQQMDVPCVYHTDENLL